MILKSPTTWLSLIVAISLGVLAARFRLLEPVEPQESLWQALSITSTPSQTKPSAETAPPPQQSAESQAPAPADTASRFEIVDGRWTARHPATSPRSSGSDGTAFDANTLPLPISPTRPRRVYDTPPVNPRESSPEGALSASGFDDLAPEPITPALWTEVPPPGNEVAIPSASSIAVTPAVPTRPVTPPVRLSGMNDQASDRISQVSAVQDAPTELVTTLPNNVQQAISTIQTQAQTTESGETRLTLPTNTLSTGQSLGLKGALPSANGTTSLRADSRVEGDREKISLRLNNEDLRLVLEMVSMESGLSILTSESVQGKVTANISNVSTMQALEAILANAGYQIQQRNDILFVGTPEDFRRMEEVSLESITRVIRPCFVSAAELEALLKPQLTPSGTIQVTSAAVHGLAQSNSTGPTTTLGSVGMGGNGGNGNGANTSNYTGNDIIVVRDVPTAVARVEELVQQIDVPPLQVAIEALILSVNLDDKHRLGVNLELLKGDGVRVVSGTMPGTLDTLETGQGLLSLGFLEANVGSFIAALDDIGETNVIAAPHVLALNKMPAQILIGEQIGFANTTVTQTAATQSIQFLDVGTQLQLRPHVNDEGLIRLEIHPEVSQGTVRSVGDLALPEKTVTQVTTNVMCRDNETIIIGGLIREEIDDTHRGVPLVGKMPILGPIFRSRSRNTNRQELLVLLTPHVIRDPADALPDPQVVNNLVDRRAAILTNERKNWVLRKQEAQRYVSLARNAWVSGNRLACERYATIAVELDPSVAESLSFIHSTDVEFSDSRLPSSHTVGDSLTLPAADCPADQPSAIIRYVDETGVDRTEVSPSGLPVSEEAAQAGESSATENVLPNARLGLPFGLR